MMIETCSLKWLEVLYSTSELTAPDKAAKPTRRVLPGASVDSLRACDCLTHRFLNSWSVLLDSTLLKAVNLRRDDM